MKYSKWLKEWLVKKRKFIKDSTYSTYAMTLKNHLIPVLGDKEIENINESVVQDAIDYWVSLKTLSSKSIKDITVILKATLKSYSKTYGKPQIIIDEIIIPKNYNSQVEILSDSEQIKIIKTIHKNATGKNIGLALGIYTGMRIGEICALKWGNVNLDSKTLQIVETQQRIYYPSENLTDPGVTRIVEGKPKTLKSSRTLSLTTSMSRLLLAIQPDNVDLESYIITGTQKCLEQRSLRDYFYSTLKKCGIEKKKFHILRHTFASKAISCGIDVKTVSSILGHSSVTLTYDLYVHTTVKTMREAFDKIENEWL